MSTSGKLFLHACYFIGNFGGGSKKSLFSGDDDDHDNNEVMSMR